MQNRPKKEPYVSIDMEETKKLRQLSFRERWLYLELKWLANFRTGKVGRYLNRTIDYTYLAGLVSVPATQGRAAESVTGGDVKRMLDHLRQAELISEICDEGAKGLSFNLLVSPIEPVAKTTNGIQSLGGEMLQVTKAEKSSEKPASVGISSEQDNAQSVLMSFGHNNTFFNTDSNDGAGDTPAHTPVRPETLPAQTTRGGLSAAQFHKRLTESWFAFQYLDTDVSRTFYRGWENRHVTEAEFDLAVERVETDESVTPTPGAVEKVLLAMRRPRKPSRRGKVAL